jgi:hypothetical protein
MKLEYKYFGTICIGLMSSLSCLRAIFVFFFASFFTCGISILWRTAGRSEDIIQLARGLSEIPVTTVSHSVFIV